VQDNGHWQSYGNQGNSGVLEFLDGTPVPDRLVNCAHEKNGGQAYSTGEV
jgi:CRISPR/Cas system CMR subunit Cmr6 (Cas7 group RAMP superfamily)